MANSWTARNVIVASLVAILAISFFTIAAHKPGPSSRAVSSGTPLIKSGFALTDHTGRKRTDRDFSGRWQLVFFGFTHCPDVCPTSLSLMSQILDALGKDAQHIAPLFITVDPSRDTPEVLRQYLAPFHSSIVGLTGSEDEVRSAAKSFRVYYSQFKQNGAPDGYLVNHSGYIYLMRPDGSYATHFSEKGDPLERIVASIMKRLVK